MKELFYIFVYGVVVCQKYKQKFVISYSYYDLVSPTILFTNQKQTWETPPITINSEDDGWVKKYTEIK